MNDDAFMFPSDVLPHTGFGPKHIFMMAAVSRALAAGKAGLRILEVGAWVGASTLLWCEAIRRFGGPEIAAQSSVLVIDSWAPILSSEDLAFGKYRQFVNAAKDDLAYNIFCHNARIGAGRYGVAIDHRRGRSDEILPDLPSEAFDIVFVDAGHYYDDVAFDVAEAKRLVQTGGVVCGDDLNLWIDQIDVPAATAASNRDIILDPRSGAYHHPGVTLAVGEAFAAVGMCGGFWSADKITAVSFAPTPIRFERAFLPSFLAEAEQAEFRDNVTPYFPDAFTT